MEIKIHTCEQCGDCYDDKRAVRNSLVLDNGLHSLARHAMCDNCSKEIFEFIESRKKELRLKVKKYEEIK